MGPTAEVGSENRCEIKSAFDWVDLDLLSPTAYIGPRESIAIFDAILSAPIPLGRPIGSRSIVDLFARPDWRSPKVNRLVEEHGVKLGDDEILVRPRVVLKKLLQKTSWRQGYDIGEFLSQLPGASIGRRVVALEHARVVIIPRTRRAIA